MGERKRVVLYGQSVILGAVQAGLRPHAQLEVISLAQPATVQELAALAPDVILFDAGAGFPEPAFALLRTRPGLLLVGVDPDRNRAVAWSGQQLCELSVQDLVEVIHKEMPISHGSPGGGAKHAKIVCGQNGGAVRAA
jgi:hypothetical protein